MTSNYINTDIVKCNNIEFKDTNYKNVKVFEVNTCLIFSDDLTYEYFVNNEYYLSYTTTSSITFSGYTGIFTKNKVYKATISGTTINFSSPITLDYNTIIIDKTSNKKYFYSNNDDLECLTTGREIPDTNLLNINIYNASGEIFNSYNDTAFKNIASGKYSHAEGFNTTASGIVSHAEGTMTMASGDCSHAEGGNTIASGDDSHAGGLGTIAYNNYMTAVGKYNIDNSSSPNTDSKLFVVGNGSYDDIRSDAFVVKDNGDCNIQNDLFLNNVNIKKIINDLCYPVSSFFLYNYKIILSNGKPTTITNTPLDYGSWRTINDSDNNTVLGLSKTYNVSNAGWLGDPYQLISASQLPPHSHRSIITTDAVRPTGSGGDVPCIPAETPSGSTHRRNYNAWTDDTIGTLGTAESSGYRAFTAITSQSRFIPRGYYIFCYIKTSLD